MGQQVTIAASQVDKERLGYQAISLTHFTDTAEPSIAAGSKVEIGGALYEFTADETGTGWGGIGASNFVYLLITPAGAACSWSYTTTAPTWDTAKQGWYTSGNRVVAMLYKDASSQYAFKSFMPGTPTADTMIYGKLHHLPTWNTTSRQIAGYPQVPPAAGNWYASALSVAGSFGVPTGAKAARIRCELNVYATAAGNTVFAICLSDNNANTPSSATSHPIASGSGYRASAGLGGVFYVEVDVPLNSAGQFYFYTLLATNVTVGSCALGFAVTGFYMGD